MNKIVYIFLYSITGIWLSSLPAQPELHSASREPQKIEEAIKNKNQEAHEAQSRAEQAKKEAEIAQKEAERYQTLYKKHENDNDKNLSQEYLKQQQKFATEASNKFALQKSEEEKSTKLIKEANNLAESQKEENKIANNFTESKSNSDDFIEEQFQNCIEKIITNQLKISTQSSTTYKDLMRQLSEQLKALEIYERTIFYMSSTITNEQWEKIREEALQGKGSYETKYRNLLHSIEEIKNKISGLLKKQSPTPSHSEVNDCFIQNYSLIDEQLKSIEKATAEENNESSPWL